MCDLPVSQQLGYIEKVVFCMYPRRRLLSTHPLVDASDAEDVAIHSLITCNVYSDWKQKIVLIGVSRHATEQTGVAPDEALVGGSHRTGAACTRSQ